MKKIFLLMMLAGLWVGCNVDSSQIIRYRVNEPVFSSAETFRQNPQITAQTPLANPCGKIIEHNHHLYISNPGKGIHIIDNTNTQQPQNKAFIQLPGYQDMAIHGQKLYIEALIDLLALDLSDPANPRLQSRTENIFPDALPPTGNEHSYDYESCQKGIAQGRIVTGWTLKERTYQTVQGGYSYDSTTSPILAQGNALRTESTANSSFSTLDNYLYASINNYLYIVDLSPDLPQTPAEKLPVGPVEKLLLHHNKLLLSSAESTAIYSLDLPQTPTLSAQIPHVYGCNPIVLHNNRAYITIRSGNACGQNTSELLIIDLTNPKTPQKTISYALKDPQGLNVRDDLLFLCDDGLKIYLIEKPETLLSRQIAHFAEIQAQNVIPLSDTLLLVADGGLYQYSYSDAGLQLLSSIPIKK
jgi:hypothetical protein